jgi:8-oxo-dGTP pyrophosphatase MutT (NUDIX family)
VACALFDERGQARVVLTRRSSQLRSHTGQVSLPGGRVEAGEDPYSAALREAQEEIGLDRDKAQLIGRLSVQRTVVNPAPITPFVVAMPGRPQLHPNPDEVERVFTPSLVELMSKEVYHAELWGIPGEEPERSMHVFEIDGETVWGATARILFELLEVTCNQTTRQRRPLPPTGGWPSGGLRDGPNAR